MAKFRNVASLSEPRQLSKQNARRLLRAISGRPEKIKTPTRWYVLTIATKVKILPLLRVN
jgi:hypothetical protein